MISVIVPVYNDEKYLDKCVQSILGQTYTDFELILIDDGSTDNSGKMCDSYCKENDKKIVVIHQNNGGPSIARNRATLEAKGDLITFIDSDDFVTLDYLQTLYMLLKVNNADISAVMMSEVQEKVTPKLYENSRRALVMSGREALIDILYQNHLDTTPCGMLFKKRIVLNHPFPEGKFHEDDFTMYKYFEDADIVAICPQIKYFYVQHESSIMHTLTYKIMNDEIEATDNLEHYFKEADVDIKKASASKKFSNYCQIILKYKNIKQENNKIYIKLSNYLQNTKWEIIKNNQCRLKNRVAAVILLFGTRTFQNIGRLLNR